MLALLYSRTGYNRLKMIGGKAQKGCVDCCRMMQNAVESKKTLSLGLKAIWATARRMKTNE